MEESQLIDSQNVVATIANSEVISAMEANETTTQDIPLNTPQNTFTESVKSSSASGNPSAINQMRGVLGLSQSNETGYVGYLTHATGLASGVFSSVASSAAGLVKNYLPSFSSVSAQYKETLGENNDFYLKVGGVVILFLVFMLGYITFALLNFLHFVNLTILSLRFLDGMKSRGGFVLADSCELQSLLERWVGYAMLIFVSDVLDCVFGYKGFGLLTLISLNVKILLYYNFIVSPDFYSKLNTYGMKMYKINHSGIDKFQKGLESCQIYVKDTLSWNQLIHLKNHIPGFTKDSTLKTL